MSRARSLAELLLLAGIVLLSIHLLSTGRARSRGALGVGSENEFVRGDSNDDSEIDIADPVFVIRYLFLGGVDIPCPAAADVDDDGAVEVDDVVGVLVYLFLRGSAPAEPFPAPGVDPTPDLGCREAPLPAAGPVGSLGGPDRELDPDESLSFRRGLALFGRPFGFAHGLGPRFNGDSCRGCHHDPVIGGAGGLDLDVVRFSGLDQDVVVPLEGGPATSRLSIRGVSREECPAETGVIETRQTPSLLGLGLVDRLPEAVLLANEDPEDLDGDGISGRARSVGPEIGRFGHKAGVPTLRDFTADALFNELGLTVDPAKTPFAGVADDDGVDEPELSGDDFEDLVFLVSHLAPPARQIPEDDFGAQRVAEGEAIFEELGCAACHVAQLVGDEGPVPAYSDFLLHDVADPSRHHVEELDVDPREFRTAPLWGLRLSAPYLHDGSAENVREAVRRGHHGEASAARAAYDARSLDDQRKLEEFLLSL